MKVLLNIGEFSRMTHLGVAALRHYHDFGLLIPACVDQATGYRRYSADQIPSAQLVRRLRDLDVPLSMIRDILDAPDASSRDSLLRMHLDQVERELERAKAIVSSLRALLENPGAAATVEYRTEPSTSAFALRGHVGRADVSSWCAEVFTELFEAFEGAPVVTAGPGGALFSDTFFEEGAGEIVAFVPIAGEPAHPLAVELLTVPEADLAVAIHSGPYEDLDRTYGALGGHVTARRLGAPGPVREYYVVTPADSPDPADLRTEVCWPVLHR